MIKKSLIQGLLLCIAFYLAIFFFNIVFEIKLVDVFTFSQQGIVLFYIFISVGVIMFMRI